MSLRKNFDDNEHHSFKFMFTFSIVVDLPTDCVLSFFFPAETDVLVPVLSQSIDVVLAIVNCVTNESLRTSALEATLLQEINDALY